MIPLRPLGVGEILDGAVTTVRRNPRAMLGLSAAVAVFTQLIGMFVVWWVMGDAVATLESAGEFLTTEEALDLMGTALGGAAIVLFVSLITTVFLTGMLTVVVGRAAIGQHLTIAETWQHAKGRLPRLFGLTFLFTLIWVGTLLGGVFASVLLAELARVPALALLGVVASAVAAVWLYVKFALSTPALMLETTTVGYRPAVPIGIVDSLRRSSRLVAQSWWRTFGILLLVLVVVLIVTYAIGIPFSLPATLGDGDMFTMAGMSFGALVVSTVGDIIALTITAPFSAGATVLLYIDRRIRREALDIELARAANVELPGRSDRPGHEGWPPDLR